MAHPHWPLFDLEVRTPHLTMRYIDDDLAVELVTLARRGIHDDAFMPFLTPWTRRESPDFEREAMQFYWRCRAETSPSSWNINFAVIVDDQVVGTTGVMASDFARLRQFETGSWLGREFQGRGIGKEMRVASLALGFDGFDADLATTAAWHDNAPSLGVTRSLGYSEQGWRRSLRDDSGPDRMIGFAMPQDHFRSALAREDIEIVGIDAVRSQLRTDRAD